MVGNRGGVAHRATGTTPGGLAKYHVKWPVCQITNYASYIFKAKQ